MAIRARVWQGIGGILPRRPSDLDVMLTSALSPRQQVAFRLLSTYDQRHLCNVYRHLEDAGSTDRDLLQAALLHDLGKAALGGRVRLVDRTLNVLLRAVSPALHERLTRLPAFRWRLGLALARHHPELGAEWAARLGCSRRTCWLIAHHADESPPSDPELQQLMAADNASLRWTAPARQTDTTMAP